MKHKNKRDAAAYRSACQLAYPNRWITRFAPMSLPNRYVVLTEPIGPTSYNYIVWTYDDAKRDYENGFRTNYEKSAQTEYLKRKQ